MFTITPAAPADVAAAATVLGRAFSRDTVMSTMFGSSNGDIDPARVAALFRPLLRAGAMKTGRVDVARHNDDSRVIGVSVWESPTPHRLWDQLLELPAFVQALGARRLLPAARLQAQLASHRPAEPHWYLAQIGVDPEARGLGVGSALLASRLAWVDSKQMSVYLESSNTRNRALYKRHGFTPIADIQGLPDATPVGMWRQPSPLRAR